MLPILAVDKTQQVFKSIGDSLDKQVNPNHILLIILALIAIVLLISFLTRDKTRKEQAKIVHNTPKLTRQLAKQLGLKPNEMRQLKQLAEQENIDNPLVLLLCPSVLQTAMKKRQAGTKE